MKYLLLNSLLLLCACTSSYKGLQKAPGDAACVGRFRPQYEGTVIYNTQVDVLNNHFSGLLLFKKMEDSSMRIVFTNEMGFKFFDFGFDADGGFTKYYVTPKMDRKAVVKTLRKDFEMLLMPYDFSRAEVLQRDGQQYVKVKLDKGAVYYITAANCRELIKVQNGSRRKPVVDLWMKAYREGIPDSLDIIHQKFKFNISSQRVIK
ncbi:hypothetical protein MKQ68_02120 [Chitinophaga horti]|uniref:Lipoprotein n=1 Tax=Chitinophaga horti TaxID=2920382 RepID=A0ABY6J2J8_9BACT|nr:hypothetical protein [Chitinophaga horti]UYQ93891.1 hypothetical protein MKQ68_02120 [Chitinophaga horti]